MIIQERTKVPSDGFKEELKGRNITWRQQIILM